jgi:RNA polymerase sigma-70 factor (ECF subfamily)
MLDWLRSIGSSDPTDRPSTNEEWLAALQEPNRDPEALAALRSVLIRGLRAALKKRDLRQAGSLAEDFAQEALVKILDKLDTFRGESKFTTWAQKIAVRTAFTELRRKRWENVSLQDMLSEEGEAPTMPDAAATPEDRTNPEESTSQQLLLNRVQHVIEGELTERQQTAIQAVMQDMPLEEVARRMDTSRNALYKAIYDARQKIKSLLEERHGITADQLLDELG